MHMSEKHNKLNRRQFIGQCAHTVGSMSILGLLLGSYARQSASTPARAIRPPGAIAEEDFTGACVRCGLCVRDCPYDTLKLAEFGSDVATGTPYFIARDIPCEMCEDIPCVAACPTGALSKELTDILRRRYGRGRADGSGHLLQRHRYGTLPGLLHCLPDQG